MFKLIDKHLAWVIVLLALTVGAGYAKNSPAVVPVCPTREFQNNKD